MSPTTRVASHPRKPERRVPPPAPSRATRSRSPRGGSQGKEGTALAEDWLCCHRPHPDRSRAAPPPGPLPRKAASSEALWVRRGGGRTAFVCPFVRHGADKPREPPGTHASRKVRTLWGERGIPLGPASNLRPGHRAASPSRGRACASRGTHGC